MDSDYPLEPSAEELRAMLAAAGDRIAAHVASLADQPAAYTDLPAAERAAEVLQPALPEAGRPLEELLDLVFELIRHSFNTAGPGYLAYIPGGGLPDAAIADLVTAAVNRYVGVYVTAPALVALEARVGRWMCDLLGLPGGALGLLTTGGSLANFTAIFTARRERLDDDFLRAARLYVTDQAHHSVRRAATLAGFSDRHVVPIPTDDALRMRPDALAERVASDRAAGLEPFLVVASAGTTNTGAVDPLGAIADVCERAGLWLHVDAAYGGFFALTERGRACLAGIERADSITLDPHKGLFLPYGTGALLVRDGGALARAHEIEADYMPPMQDHPDRVDYCRVSPELSRDLRGLRVWLPIMRRGLGAFRSALDEKLDLAQHVATTLRGLPHVELVAEPQLSVVAFRWTPPGATDVDALNRQLIEAVNARQRVYISGARVRGRQIVRVAVLSFRTHRDRVDAGLSDIVDTMAGLARQALDPAGPGW